jgi:hypothetical protein
MEQPSLPIEAGEEDNKKSVKNGKATFIPYEMNQQ